MANFGIKQFNYNNVVNYKNTLITNRDQMDDLFNKYKTELTNLESSWMGQSGSISRDDMNYLIQQYYGFLNKVNDFITTLSNTETTFSDTEKQNMSTYNS